MLLSGGKRGPRSVKIERTLIQTFTPVNILFSLDSDFFQDVYCDSMGDFLTVRQFADRLGLEPATVYIAIKDQRVQSTEILGRVGIPKTELRRFKRRRNGIKTKVLRKFSNGR